MNEAIKEFIAALTEFADENEFLMQRSADRYHTIDWVIDQLHQNKIPSREVIKNRIMYGRD